jgi:hypothetical protein
MVEKIKNFNGNEIFRLANRGLLGILFISQGGHVLYTGKFFNFKGEPFVDASHTVARYPISLILIIFGFFILYRIFYPKENPIENINISADQEAVLNSTGPFPLRLKATIAYFAFYAFIVEILFAHNFGKWKSALLAVQSSGTQLAMLTQGPLLGVIFLISIIGLLNRKLWGRKWAVVALIIATLADAKGLAWSITGKNVVDSVYFASLGMVGLWNSIWIYFLFSSGVTSILRR